MKEFIHVEQMFVNYSITNVGRPGMTSGVHRYFTGFSDPFLTQVKARQLGNLDQYLENSWLRALVLLNYNEKDYCCEMATGVDSLEKF